MKAYEFGRAVAVKIAREKRSDADGQLSSDAVKNMPRLPRIAWPVPLRRPREVPGPLPLPKSPPRANVIAAAPMDTKVSPFPTPARDVKTLADYQREYEAWEAAQRAERLAGSDAPIQEPMAAPVPRR